MRNSSNQQRLHVNYTKVNGKLGIYLPFLPNLNNNLQLLVSNRQSESSVTSSKLIHSNNFSLIMSSTEDVAVQLFISQPSFFSSTSIIMFASVLRSTPFFSSVVSIVDPKFTVHLHLYNTERPFLKSHSKS